jgi:hypothetical protein
MMNWDHVLDVASQLIALATLALVTWRKMKHLDGHLDDQDQHLYKQDQHLARQDQHLEKHATQLEQLKNGDNGD